MLRSLTLFLLLFSFFSVNAQGVIRGVVIDKETGETIIGAAIQCLSCVNGTASDLDGNFSLNAREGSHSIEIKYFTYKTLQIDNISVSSNDITLIGDLFLESEDNLKLDEVLIVAEASRNTEASLLTLKKKSIQIIDGISASKMSQTGDGTAVEAAKRITGVSIEGGKYVYIRGLGDRYSKTTLNGMDIPGLDPDKNTIQMDIFPTDLVSNIVISKSFTADQSADFTGGLLNIETKAFPNKKIFKITYSNSYNPSMSLRKNYITYNGGSTDFLGFDDGTRALPLLATSNNIPTPISGASSSQVNSFVRSFDPNLGTIKKLSLLDLSLGLTMGNQWEWKNRPTQSGEIPKLGYIFSMSYKSNYNFYENVFYGEYQRYGDPDSLNLRYATKSQGKLGENNILIGALGGFTYKTNLSKVRITLMHLQNGVSRAGEFDIENDESAVGQSGYYAASDNLEYNQRSLTNLLINGTRAHPEKNTELDWRIAPTLSISNDPDLRKTAFTFSPVDTLFIAGAGGNPSRIWRSLREINLPARIDITKKLTIFNEPAKFKFGTSNTFKSRYYEISFFDMQFFGSQNWQDANPQSVLLNPNIYPNDYNNIYYQSGNNDPNPNKYNSNSNTAAAYFSSEFELNIRLKGIMGLRAEHFIQRHTGRDQTYANGDRVNGQNLINDIVLNSLDLFPSLNLIYSLSENQKIRLSATRTIARPSFKELSFAQIIDPITNRIFNGSFFKYSAWSGVLKETNVTNLDVRWEEYAKRGQMFSISAFYKNFINPIEMVRIAEQQSSTEFQPRNVGFGNMIGTEIEWNSSLTGFSPAFKNIFFNGNITLINSQITMSDVEYNSRKDYERTNEIVNDNRQMAGQSPYVINTGFTYSSKNKNSNFGLFYNVKGPTLKVVGLGLFPDIFSLPFHSLNASFTTKAGANKNTDIKIRLINILKDDIQSVYKSFQANQEIFSRYFPGINLSASVTFNL
ncbi:MAG: TonB-dependent receptor SusC [Owenweeksia sp. TMED14]|nr:MAG: TonB-dependent receptor SusC [Owenweeksia sp. TMED14]